MKKTQLAAIAALLLCGTATLQAQTNVTAGSSIINSLTQQGEGEGVVRIEQHPQLNQRMGKALQGDEVKLVDGIPTLVTAGYRVQLFSGNNQRSSKQEAFAKESQLKEYAPDLTTYVIFTSPFWRLRVGDYSTFEEANRMLLRLKAQFPAFGKEMRVVASDISIPLVERPKVLPELTTDSLTTLPL